ncbi:luciferin 4-monooxygenase-like [Ostrinia nubilalis]|uniref:luciferin 4-monooxygenase-like n=1 Tax=Ostrinia nubilalis TaxID=29057 RepID=UPI00308229F7
MTEKGKKQPQRINHSVWFYLDELASRVVAQTGIPSDRFHLGKVILQSLKDDPDFVLQIDGALGVSETNGSVLERSVRCATALSRLGVQRGDVMVIMAPNHLDLAIAFYAALYLGVIIAGVDMTLGVRELVETFNVQKPKLIFCQTDKASDVETALLKQNNKTHVITFDKGSKFYSFTDFLEENADDTRVEDFKPTDFDPEETVAFLTSTSGSTGLPKAAILTHKSLTILIPPNMSRCTDFPTPTKLSFSVSPLQWVSAGIQYTASPIYRYTRLQTSAPCTKEHIYDIINKYKPTSIIMSPTYMSILVAAEDRGRCDFTCFKSFVLGGSHVPTTLINTLKSMAPKADIIILYAMSEIGTVTGLDEGTPLESIGKVMGHLQYRLVDPSTLEDIKEPNVPGELWVKGPTLFKGYYNNPEATKEAFSEDGWFKTGDLLRRDANYNFFFVDRLKTLLKYRNHQISPVEVEGVIRKHPGVVDVVVVGVPDEECGDLPAACVVPRAPGQLTAQEIKDLVKDNLTDTKRLRGGVVFMDHLPMMVSTKVDRMKLKKMVAEMKQYGRLIVDRAEN